MTTYSMTGPDGKTYSIDGPAGASPQQVKQQLAQQFAQQKQSQPVQSPGDQAFAAGQQAGQQTSGLAAGLDQAARQYLPFGLGNDVGAAARYVGQRATGVQNPDSFATDLAFSGGQSQGETEGSPVASTVGGLAGGIGQGYALTPLAEAAMPFKAALALKAGQTVKNAAKVAAAGSLAGATYGAATGAVQGGINNGDPSLTNAVTGAATQGVEGAVVGAPLGLAGAAAANVPKIAKAVFTSDASANSIAALAKAWGVSPSDVQQTYGQFKLDTGGTLDPKTGVVTGGRDPAMGELTDLYNRGEVHALVGKNPLLGGTVANAANDAANSLPARLMAHASTQLGPPQDPADLVSAQRTRMTAAMDPIRNQMIALHPQDVELLRGEVLPNSGLTQLGRKAVHNDLDTGEISLGNIDTLRQSLNARAAANPGEGFDQLAAGVRQIGTDNSQDYAHALDQYAQDARYIDAHAHGLTGKTIGQTDDPRLISALATPEGKEGYQSGLATRIQNALGKSPSSAAATAADLSGPTATAANVAQTFNPATQAALSRAAGAEGAGAQSLRSIAPAMPKAPESVNMGQAALSVVSHSLPMKVYHLIRAQLGAGMSDDVARITANYLTNPGMAKQGFALMARHGVDQAQTRQMLQNAASVGGRVGAQGAMAIQGQ